MVLFETDFDITSHKYKYDYILDNVTFQHCRSMVKVTVVYGRGYSSPLVTSDYLVFFFCLFFFCISALTQ